MHNKAFNPKLYEENCMLIKVIKKQTIFLLKQKEASLTFILLLAVVLGNYITNVLTFRGTDVSQMYQPMKLLALSLNKVYFSANIQLLIVMIYPILVAVPAGFSYTKEQQTKEEVYMIYRLGKNRYLQSKLWAFYNNNSLYGSIYARNTNEYAIFSHECNKRFIKFKHLQYRLCHNGS